MDKLHEEIAKVAYELFEKRGGSEGHHLDDWLEAERIVRARQAKAEREKEKPAKAAVKRTSVRTPRKKEPATGDGALPKKKTAARKTTASKKTT